MSAAAIEPGNDAKLRSQVRSAVIWRSGTQVFSQLVDESGVTLSGVKTRKRASKKPKTRR